MDDIEDNMSFLESEPSLLDMGSSYYRNESKKKAQRKFVYLGVFVLTITILEYFTRDYMKIFSDYLFASSNPNRCEKYIYFEFYQYSGRYFILFLLYNYCNVFSALCLIFLDSFSLALTGVLRFLYLDPRPFWENGNIFPCYCATDYANPSTTGTNLFVIMGTFYLAMTSKLEKRYQKNLIFFISAITVTAVYLIRLFQGVDYLHQIIFGLLWGIAIHYWFYYILKLNFNNRKQFRQIINQPIIVSTLTISLFAVINIIYFNSYFETKPSLVLNIQKFCNIDLVSSYDKETYSKSVKIFEFYGCYIGILIEYWFSFKGNLDVFARYNIKSKGGEMFLDTPKIKSLLRFLLFYFVQVIFFKSIIMAKINESYYKNSSTLGLAMFMFVPITLQGIFFFFVMKRAVVWLGLTNEKVAKITNKDELSESIRTADY